MNVSPAPTEMRGTATGKPGRHAAPEIRRLRHFRPVDERYGVALRKEPSRLPLAQPLAQSLAGEIGREQDVAVIGFDNVPESEYFFRGITTVNQPKYQLGETCIELLLEKIEDVHSEIRQIVLPHSLVLRGSTSCLSAP